MCSISMKHTLYFCFLYLTSIMCINAVEMTFELPDNAKQCFFEEIDADVKTLLEYQVITGGNFDVDAELIAPNGQSLYKDVRKQYDTYMFTTSVKGQYKFCFSNEFSTFSHKVVYFDFQVGDDQPLNEIFGNSATALTQMETSCRALYESFKITIDYQTHHRLRESQGRGFAEDLNEKVFYWSVLESLIVIVIGVGQIFVLRSFFSERSSTTGL